MRRAPATVVILAWNEWQATRACLESLRSTLHGADEVIVVDNGSTDQTPRGLDQYPWVKRLTNTENRGFAAGCNQGAAVATNEVVVFLNNDTLLAGRWLDALLEPFADTSIGATGARSNFVSGPQLVPNVGYRRPKRAEIRRFERKWRESHRGEWSDVDRLVGFCLAVRRDAFTAVGGFDEGFGLGGYEDDDLCQRLRVAGHRLVIAHGSFVHHEGHRTFDANGIDWFHLQQQNGERYRRKHGSGIAASNEQPTPLLSACLIVRDEERRLPACLQSLGVLADEVVVYDTGSQDRTLEIARSSGATVIEGYWDDDFARARNAALEACAGEWILHIDADEELCATGDLRAELQGAASDALLVQIDNVNTQNGVMYSHAAVRLFRRAHGRWSGRLHEQVVDVDSQRPLHARQATSASLRHWGYSDDETAAKNKLERNLKMSRAAVRDTEERDGTALLHLARSLTAVGQMEEALSTFEKVLARPVNVRERRLVGRSAAALLTEEGRPAEALIWLEKLRPEAEDLSIVDYLEGCAYEAAGDVDAALRALLPLERARDGDGYEVPRHMLLRRQGEVCARAGRWQEALERLTAGATLDPAYAPWALIATACQVTRSSGEQALAMVEERHLVTVLSQLEWAPPAAAELLMEALWNRFPQDPALLAGGSRLAPKFDLSSALEWSARLRSAGLHAVCPLAAIARTAGRMPLDRLRAAAIVAGAFDPDEGTQLLADLAEAVESAYFSECLRELDALAPTLLPSFVQLLATTPERCRHLSGVLTQLGAPEEAQITADLSDVQTASP